LTLIETLLALLMLSLLIVGLLGLLGSLLVSSTKVSDQSAGTYAAQYLLEQASTGSPPDPAGGTEEGVRRLLTHENTLPVDFNYRLEWTLLSDIRSYSPASGTGRREVQFGARLYRVKCNVWWMIEAPQDGRAEGGGKRTVTLERIIKVGKQ
jgi:type II secretory pathway pseudopilin PulG